jgi:pre-mRNA-processing factor 6
MNSLDNIKINSSNEINDIKRARALFKSVIASNPESASGWVAAARIEELDGKVQEARNIIARACDKFYDNEDIWLEATRLSPPEKQKYILAKALKQMPMSRKLWI